MGERLFTGLSQPGAPPQRRCLSMLSAGRWSPESWRNFPARQCGAGLWPAARRLGDDEQGDLSAVEVPGQGACLDGLVQTTADDVGEPVIDFHQTGADRLTVFGAFGGEIAEQTAFVHGAFKGAFVEVD
nr:hypothetical protein [Tanacetum cinerariifolium]